MRDSDDYIFGSEQIAWGIFFLIAFGLAAYYLSR
jgi:hypothetical protein